MDLVQVVQEIGTRPPQQQKHHVEDLVEVAEVQVVARSHCSAEPDAIELLLDASQRQAATAVIVALGSSKRQPRSSAAAQPKGQ